jgi:prevent-host-death family protein
VEAVAVAAKHLITVGELVRRFSQYSDIALVDPVVVTKNGRPRNVLISIEEYERLKKRDQQAFLAADTPERFLAEIEALAVSENS